MTAILFWMLLALQLQTQQAEGGSRDGTRDGMEHRRFPAVRSHDC